MIEYRKNLTMKVLYKDKKDLHDKRKKFKDLHLETGTQQNDMLAIEIPLDVKGGDIILVDPEWFGQACKNAVALKKI